MLQLKVSNFLMPSQPPKVIMMLRLKLNDRLVDIASEGLLRPKLYDEKETFDFTAVKNC
jgi:hypothetical protein